MATHKRSIMHINIPALLCIATEDKHKSLCLLLITITKPHS